MENESTYFSSDDGPIVFGFESGSAGFAHNTSVEDTAVETSLLKSALPSLEARNLLVQQTQFTHFCIVLLYQIFLNWSML